MLFVFTLLTCELLIIGTPTPASLKNSLYFSRLDKDSLLANVPKPRLIFVGGSNLSFGLNGQIIVDSLHLNPINTAIHASIGIIYMMDQTLKYIKAGDIIVLAPEYGNFFDHNAYGAGGYELLVSALEVSHDYLSLRPKQIFHTLKYFPQYTRAKINPRNYLLPVDTNDIYSRRSFNRYGDAKNHWSLAKPEIPNPSFSFGEKVDSEVFTELKHYNDKLKEKGASLFLSYPSIQQSSYDTQLEKIILIEKLFKQTKIKLLGTPKDFVFPDSMMFNSAYHLSKPAADLRTKRLIKQLEGKF